MPRRVATRKPKSVVYKIPQDKGAVLADFPTGARDAAGYADSAKRKADRGECEGALSAYSDAATAFGRADEAAKDRSEKEQLDRVLWPKLQGARAAITRCFRSSK